MAGNNDKTISFLDKCKRMIVQERLKTMESTLQRKRTHYECEERTCKGVILPN